MICFIFAPLAAAQEQKTTYSDHILPVLRQSCLSCHNADQKKGGLDMSSYTGLMQGGSGGSVIEPGNADASRLFRVMNHDEQPQMPPNADKLPQNQLDLFQRWINEGVLETAGSKALTGKKPAIDLSVSAGAVGRPDGPPPMPEDVLLEPVVHVQRMGPIADVVSSPWAPLVAVTGQKQVLLYHSDSRELAGVLPFGDSFPQVLRFSRTGQLLLVAGGRGAEKGFAQLFEVTTGRSIAIIGDEYDSVLAADVAADQSCIALGGPSKVLKIFATSDGRLLHTITRHTDWVTAIAYSPDAVLLASGDRQGNLHIWEAHSANLFHTLTGHTAAITALDYRSDSNVLLSAGEDGTVRLWAMKDGSQIKSWGAHPGGTLTARFTHDGSIVTGGRDGTVKIWDAAGNQKKTIQASKPLVTAVTFSHDGKQVFAGDYLGRVTAWQAEAGHPVGQLDVNPPSLAQRISRIAEQIRTLNRPAAHNAIACEIAADNLQHALHMHLAALRLRDQSARAKAAENAQPVSNNIPANHEKLLHLAEKSLATARLEYNAALEAHHLSSRQLQEKQAQLKALQCAQFNIRVLAAREKMQAALTTRDELKAVMKDLTEQMAKAQDQFQQDHTQLNEGLERMLTLQQSVTDAQAQMDQAEQAKVQAKKTVAARRGLISELETVLEKLQTAAEAQPDNVHLREAVQKSTEALTQLREDLQSAEQAVSRRDGELAQARLTLETATQTQQQADDTLQALPAQLTEQQAHIEQLQTDLHDIAENLPSADKAAVKAEQDYKTLNEQYEKMKKQN